MIKRRIVMIRFPAELYEKMRLIATEKYTSISSVIMSACSKFVLAEKRKKNRENKKVDIKK